MVDERHDCQDIGPAYVPGTVWGTASSQTGKFRSRRRACLLIPTSRRRVSHSGVHRRTGGDQRDAITPSISDTPSGRIESGKPTSLQTVRRRAPDKRGSGQPSTFGAWGKVFPDPAMTLAAVDRLVHHASIFEINVDSYRRRAALERKQKGPGRPQNRATIKDLDPVSLHDNQTHT